MRNEKYANIFASEIGAEEHDDDVRCKNVSGNMAALCMRSASGRNNYRNSSVIVAMGQIPHSTERIAS